LGDFYTATNSVLTNGGSTTADVIGLYHFTTQTNQVKETTTTNDIGYHYVAVDSTGQPMDTDGDSTPDYLQDSSSTSPFVIYLMSPTNTHTFAEPVSLPMRASVMDWSSTVTNVDFFHGSTRITAISTPPYTYSWPLVAAGSYTLTAVAKDMAGLSATSNP